MINEPILDKHDIQGHVLPGFGTRYLRMLGFKIADVTLFKEVIQPWLASITDTQVANEKRKARGLSLSQTGKRPDDPTVMMSIAFSSIGLQQLGIDINPLKDRRFKRGMAFDAPELNDEYDTEGTPIGWLYGETEASTPDVMILCGCELKDPLTIHCGQLIKDLLSASQILVDQWGDRPDDDKEHFGFKDGVSQPALRGMLTDSKYLYTRYLDPGDTNSEYFSKPGQPLIWPGQIIFGYPGQSTDPLVPGQTLEPGASWMRNGSYLVVRRLRQNVKQFQDVVFDQANRLYNDHRITVSADTLMAKLVGRWPDGTPLVVSPDGPEQEVSGDRMRINHFNFDSETKSVLLKDSKVIPGSTGDHDELKCPRLAHIRKINPRDGSTAIGTEHTLAKLIVRRGINFGKRYDKYPNDERGLLFMCYQTSITNQFIFLQKNWANTHTRPTLAGHDFIIGQTSEPNNQRHGILKINNESCPISINGDWVKMTGGGYFAVPGIRGVKQVLKC